MAGRVPLDGDGQPVVAAFCARARRDRTVDELLGISKGLVADGTINESEAEFLRLWLERNAEHAAQDWPVNVISARVCDMLSDDVIDAQERVALFELLSRLVGGPKPVLETVASFSSALPLDDPQPDIVFSGRTFCLTGGFAFGPRSNCEWEIEKRGGFVQGTLGKSVNYLVVGVVGSRDWAHANFGRKIENAVTLRDMGHAVSIVSEEHWTRFLVP